MRYRTIVVLIVVAACIGGCTTAANVPATAPSSTAPITLATTTMPPTPTSTSASPTTTVDRVTEVTRIFEDLERRRLAAIYSGDVEAFTTLFADTPYLERSLEVFDLVEPGDPPDISIEVIEILRDDDKCLALYYSALIGGTPGAAPATVVLRNSGERYRYAFTNDGRGGWLCEGPHPLS
jgi:hypothetical protein